MKNKEKFGMLDYRVDTFLTLCRERNYSRTAEKLNISQPAVTQHIQYLEREYDAKLFEYENKQLVLTKQGSILYNCILGLSASDKKIYELIRNSKIEKRLLRIGVSLTIAEHVMPMVLGKMLTEYPDISVKLNVDNTARLLEGLQSDRHDCALIEGSFDNRHYYHRLFSKESFIAVGGRPYKECELKDLLEETIIAREDGSGTREIQEEILARNNLNFDNFNNRLEIGNTNLIKDMVMNQCGITFLYKIAVMKELQSGQLYEIPIKDMKVEKEFNFVVLSDNMFMRAYLDFCEYAIKHYHL